ncbi:unnamed protein product [Caenorhabditis auriculariae]|uniref:EB domain-containing protein n=1 Tax=Caenorhabditis auriculariae TaxID=2777116 RepID=A0A8S1HPY8_9PELO|nr:unnamed protein product [Caenorhabditis auriculariae]
MRSVCSSTRRCVREQHARNKGELPGATRHAEAGDEVEQTHFSGFFVSDSQMSVHNLMLRHLFLFFLATFPHPSTSHAIPVYEYLRGLCPAPMIPLTNKRTVRTCSNAECPAGSTCSQGICCIEPPMCRHPVYRSSTGHPCLPNIKHNCPNFSVCVPSSIDGMNVCCSSKTEKTLPSKPKGRSSLAKENVCPASHPVVANDGTKLVLCADCKKGVCAHFRGSNVDVCCQSHEQVCGVGSTVQMDGAMPRDCSKRPCGPGYECSLTSIGTRTCCSLATCPNGRRARAVCAAGCRRDEKCERVQGQLWCCPQEERQLRCPRGGISTGENCLPNSSLCPFGTTCEESVGGESHLCCRPATSTPAPFVLTFPPPSTQTLKRKSELQSLLETAQSTRPPFSIYCRDGALPLLLDGSIVTCPEVDQPCPKAGFTCQESENEDDFLCCPVEEGPTEERSRPSTDRTAETIKPKSHKMPTCPFSYSETKNDLNNDIKTCLGLFTFDCPFGYTCLPSSTTDSYLCCMKKPL